MIDENHPAGKLYKETLDSYNAKLVPFLSVNIHGANGKIKLHEARWISEGSGKVIGS